MNNLNPNENIVVRSNRISTLLSIKAAPKKKKVIFMFVSFLLVLTSLVIYLFLESDRIQIEFRESTTEDIGAYIANITVVASVSSSSANTASQDGSARYIESQRIAAKYGVVSRQNLEASIENKETSARNQQYIFTHSWSGELENIDDLNDLVKELASLKVLTKVDLRPKDVETAMEYARNRAYELALKSAKNVAMKNRMLLVKLVKEDLVEEESGTKISSSGGKNVMELRSTYMFRFEFVRSPLSVH